MRVRLLKVQVLDPARVELPKGVEIDLPPEAANRLIDKRVAVPFVEEVPERAVGPKARPKGAKGGNRTGEKY